MIDATTLGNELHDHRSIRMFRNSFVTTLTVCALALMLTQGRAEAQAEVFKIVGIGSGPTGLPLPGQPARPHWAIGAGTHLGNYYGSGTVETDSADFQPDGTITGEFGSGSPFVFTAGNGNKLVCWYGRTDHGASTPGTFVLTILGFTGDGSLIVSAAWIADFVPDPAASTGRFKGVTGSWKMYAYSDPFVLGSSDPVNYWWNGQGTLTFQK
jgi:hypothetical protein